MDAQPPKRQARGLTLIELLVALALLSVLALLSWRTLDGMARTQALTQAHGERWQNWRTALAQWDADLDALLDTGQVPPLDHDGRVLRLTRAEPTAGPNGPGGLLVVAWSLQVEPASGATHWARWRSGPLHRVGELDAAWRQAAQWGRNPSQQDQQHQVLLTPLADWQIFFHRGGAWSHPQSAAGAEEAQNPARDGIPDGVRLLLTLPESGPTTGRLLRDWVRPGLGGQDP
jgi:general secretion pathway protein J